MGDKAFVEKKAAEKTADRATKAAAADGEIAPEQVMEDGGHQQQQDEIDRAAAPGAPDEGGEGEGEQPRQQPKHGTPFDDKRLALARKFSDRRKEQEDPDDYDGDHRNTATNAGKLGHAAAAEGEGEGDGEQQQDQDEGKSEQPEPKMYEIKVNGRTIRLTEAEMISRAQKVESADDYLEEARRISNEAATRRTSGQDGRQPSDHEQSDKTAKDGETNEDEAANQRHNPDLIEKVKAIQFGEPEEAAQALGEIISQSAAQVGEQLADKKLLDDDIAKGRRILLTAKEKNEELFKDEDAAPMIVSGFQREYAKDLEGLGLSKEEIEKAAKAGRLPDYHRYLRVKGYEVRDQQQIADSVVQHVSTRLGYSKADGENRGNGNGPAPRQGAPRVVTNADRAQRKQDLAPQPQRSGQPQTPPRTSNVQSEDTVINRRLAAVRGARQARGQQAH